MLAAAPASSAGVERVSSTDGKMHGDLQKSAKDSTLEHSLFSAFNTRLSGDRGCKRESALEALGKARVLAGRAELGLCNVQAGWGICVR